MQDKIKKYVEEKFDCKFDEFNKTDTIDKKCVKIYAMQTLYANLKNIVDFLEETYDIKPKKEIKNG